MGSEDVLKGINLTKRLPVSYSNLKNKQSQNAKAASKIVDDIFNYVAICLREDKSKVKVSMFAKAFIQGVLNDSVKNGLKDFVTNMNEQEIKMLLDDIQRDLNMR